jgi:hypothetical protein
MLDLVVLTADKNTQLGLRALLAQPAKLGIAEIRVEVIAHPRRDPAVLREAHQFLRVYLSRARYALVVFDREGCGDTASRTELEARVQANLHANGWSSRSGVVVIDPELEAWVWSDSPHLPTVLGWKDGQAELRRFLSTRDLDWRPGRNPARPKEALEAALEGARRARSSSLYEDLAQLVSFERCQDPGFLKLRSTLSGWFPR